MALTDYKTALVTGASSGIDEATVRSLSEREI
jgi:NADP-dependent 3-hydroxy acid dehydrogenase YdfG